MNEQDGTSCLHFACSGGSLEIVKYMYELGGEKLLMLTPQVRVCVIVGGVRLACVSTYRCAGACFPLGTCACAKPA